MTARGVTIARSRAVINRPYSQRQEGSSIHDLKPDFGACQNLPRVRQESRRVCAKRCAAHGRNRVLEIVMVPEIDKIAPKLNAQILLD